MTALWILIALAALAALAVLWAFFYVKSGPNEVLVISGRRRRVRDEDGRVRVVGYRLVHGGGSFVWPLRERVQRLSMELLTLEVSTPEVYTSEAVPVTVDGVAQVKVGDDERSIGRAAQQFLSRSRDEIVRAVLQTVEGHMRAAIGGVTVEDIYRDRRGLAERAREATADDLGRMGMEIVSLTVRDITDPRGYLEALARPRIAQVKRDAVRAEAAADDEAKRSQFEAETSIEAARRDMEVEKASYEADVKSRRAQADLAYDLQRQELEQRLKSEQVAVRIAEKEKQIELERREAERREQELLAGVIRPAEAERRRVALQAQAENERLRREAEGKAEEIRATGQADAEAIRARGVAEAAAMAEKAQSWQQYNEAAVVEQFIRVLPEVAERVAGPLSQTDRIVMINGDGQGGGASRLTGDLTQVIAQLPEVLESLTGVRLERLVAGARGDEQAPDAERDAGAGETGEAAGAAPGAAEGEGDAAVRIPARDARDRQEEG